MSKMKKAKRKNAHILAYLGSKWISKTHFFVKMSKFHTSGTTNDIIWIQSNRHLSVLWLNFWGHNIVFIPRCTKDVITCPIQIFLNELTSKCSNSRNLFSLFGTFQMIVKISPRHQPPAPTPPSFGLSWLYFHLTLLDPGYFFLVRSGGRQILPPLEYQP